MQLKNLLKKIAQVWEEETRTFKYKMKPLTPSQKYQHNSATHCYLCEQKFANHQTEDQYRQHYQQMKSTNSLRANVEADIFHLGPKVFQLFPIFQINSQFCRFETTVTSRANI